MNGIGRVNLLPVVSAASSARSGRAGAAERQSLRVVEAPAAAGRSGAWSGRGPSAGGLFAPFVTQLIAGLMPSEPDRAAPDAGAITYLVARDRTTDLPAGFLVSRAV